MATRVVHYLNQFFGGRGGEERAGDGLEVREGPVGPGLLLERHLRDAAAVVGTVTFGDNAFHADPARAAGEVLTAIAAFRPDVLIAGPAFEAGRYGLACGYVCRAADERLSIAAVTAMAPTNPAVDQFREQVFIVPTAASAAGMAEAIPRVARLALRLAARVEIGDPETEGYIARGRRKNVFGEQRAAARAVDLLLRKARGEPYVSEIPTPAFDRASPAPPLRDLRTSRIALVSEGGIVPSGNPDRIESTRATRWGSYDVTGLAGLPAGAFTCVHAGWANEHANADPNRVIPLDVLRDLEREGRIGGLLDRYFVTVGSSCTVENARRFGREIATRLREAGVGAVILTAT